MRWAASLLSLLTATLAPAIALACPYCAGSARNTSLSWFILATFMLLPFPVAYAVYRFIRSEEKALAPRSTKGRAAELG